MKRRQVQNIIVWVVTLLFIAGAIPQGVAGDYRAFTIICGAYIAFLIVFTLVCRFSIPKADRVRPEIPSLFHLIHVGATPSASPEILSNANLMEERLFGTTTHQLREIRETFPNGEWICRFEVADDRVLARSLHFKSSLSPVLDYGSQQGNGRILTESVPA